MGDVILTTPVLSILRNHFPQAEIHFCTKSSYADLIRFNPNVNELIEVPDKLTFGKLRELRKLLSSARYDLVVDLHHNLRAFYLRLFLAFGSNIIKFRKYSFRKFLLVNFKINLMKKLPPIAVRYAMTLEKVGISISGEQKELLHPEIFTAGQTTEELRGITNDNKIPSDRKLICIIPSSKHYTKTYPPAYFAQLINKFDMDKYCILLVGKGDDKIYIDFIKSFLNTSAIDLCDRLNLLELTELMKMCSLVISGDTGPMHIAEAVDVPLIVIAGSSVREFGFYPQSKKAVVLENNGLNCRPCTHIGRDTCPRRHFRCMMDILPDIIYQKSALI